MERLQKFLARAGVASRRDAEELILKGRVSVNGSVVTRLGTRVDPERDRISVDGKLLAGPQPKVYLLLNKPQGCLVTGHDPQGRLTVFDLLPPLGLRLFPVGRLDRDTEGLLLLTTDGDAAFALTHPAFQVPRRYQVLVSGNPSQEKLDLLMQGVMLEDGPARADGVRILKGEGPGRTLLEILIHEGRKREVRRMCKAIGHPVISLKRVSFGPIELGNLRPGRYRFLSRAEVDWIRSLTKGVANTNLT